MLKEFLHDKFFQYKIEDRLPIRIPKKLFRREDFSAMLGSLGLNRGVEIGTQAGVNAEQFCQTNPNIDLTCVDPWWTFDRESKHHGEEKQNAFYDECCMRLKPYNAKILKMTSYEALSHFVDESLDFVYIDGCHEFDFVMNDLIGWAKKVKRDGLISGHDYFEKKNFDVITAVNAYTQCHKVTEWYITGNNTPSYFWAKP